MAGSKQIFIYSGNTGNRLVRLDESNTRALGFIPATTAAALLANAGSEVVPLTGKERYITCSGQTADGKPVSRKLIVPDDQNTFFVEGGIIELPVLVDADNGTVELVAFSVTSATGEQKQFARLGGDSGLDDGSQP